MKKLKIKSLLIGFLIGSMFFGSISFASTKTLKKAYFNNVKIAVDSKQLVSEYPVATIETNEDSAGKTYVTARELAEALGAKVDWDGKNNTVVVTSKIQESMIKSSVINSGLVKILDNEAFIMNYSDGLSIIVKEKDDFIDYKGYLITIRNNKQNDIIKLENICVKGFNTKLNSTIYPCIIQTGNFNTDKGYKDIEFKNNYELKSNEVQSGYAYFKKDEFLDELYFTDGIHSCFLKIPNNKDNINNNSENSKLSTKTELQEYLEKNYSTLSTSIGITNFTYTIDENKITIMPYDYWIQVKFDSTFFYNLQYSISFTNEQKIKAKQELKDFQEKLAKDIIAKMPDKKLYGGYYDSWYKYPNLKIDLQTQRYYSWTNYNEPDILSNIRSYEQTKPSTFRWFIIIDDEL